MDYSLYIHVQKKKNLEVGSLAEKLTFLVSSSYCKTTSKFTKPKIVLFSTIVMGTIRMSTPQIILSVKHVSKLTAGIQ